MRQLPLRSIEQDERAFTSHTDAATVNLLSADTKTGSKSWGGLEPYLPVIGTSLRFQKAVIVWERSGEGH